MFSTYSFNILLHSIDMFLIAIALNHDIGDDFIIAIATNCDIDDQWSCFLIAMAFKIVTLVLFL